MIVHLMFLRGLCVELMYPQSDVGVLSSVGRLLESTAQMALFCFFRSGCQFTLIGGEVLPFPPVVTLVSLWITKF